MSRLQLFGLVLVELMFSAIGTKYLLNTFTISWLFVIEVPLTFKVLILSVYPDLLISSLTMSQTVLFLLWGFLIMSS